MYTIEQACENGDVDRLKFLHNKNGGKDIPLMRIAAKYGQIEIMEYLYKNGKFWGQNPITIALFGSIEWYNTNIVNNRNTLITLNWLYDNFVISDEMTRDAIKKAIDVCSPEIFDFLYSKKINKNFDNSELITKLRHSCWKCRGRLNDSIMDTILYNYQGDLLADIKEGLFPGINEEDLDEFNLEDVYITFEELSKRKIFLESKRNYEIRKKLNSNYITTKGIENKIKKFLFGKRKKSIKRNHFKIS